MGKKAVLGVGILLSAAVVAWAISCGGGGSGGDSDFAGFTKTVDLDERADDIALTAGETWSLAFSVNLNMDRFGGPYSAFTLDFEDNIPGLIFSTIAAAGLAAAEPLVAVTGSINIYVGPVDAADPCTAGDGVTKYGPFVVTFDESDQPDSVDPPTGTASQDTIDIINLGAFSVCVEINSPYDATATQDEAAFTACTENIEDIAGTWTGTFYCTGTCPGGSEEEPLPVTLQITQLANAPGSASYSDSFALYHGNVCGYTFSFDGGNEDYEESGLFIMDEGGLTATKRSYYEYFEGPCRGDCYDTLMRVSDE